MTSEIETVAQKRPRLSFAGLSLRARLVMLVLTFLIPGLMLTGFLLMDLNRQAYSAQERQLIATARALTLAVDRQIGEQAALAQALSAAPSLRQGDWKAFDAQARVAMAGGDNWVVVRLSDGPIVVSTRAVPGGPLPRVGNPIGWSGGRNSALVSDLFQPPGILGGPLIIVQRALRLDDGREIKLNVLTRAETFAEVFRDQKLPIRWTGAILDSQARLVARNRDSERYAGRKASADMRDALQRQSQGIVPSRTLDGVETYSAFARIPGYNWSVLVGVPRTEMSGAARHSMIAWIVAGTILMFAAVLFAARVATGMARPTEALAQAASDWVSGRPVVIPPRTGLPETDSLGEALAGALKVLEERDTQQKLLINELNHRVKNTLATVQSIALHARRANTDIDAFHTAFEGRLMAMGSAHDLLTRTSWEGADLAELAKSILRPFLGPRLTISGPPVMVGPTTALNLCLIFYELATNATKYGALSNEQGAITLCWAPSPEGVLVTWRETEGPVTATPSRKGFGSRLIERAARDLQPAALSFDPLGVVCTLTLKPMDAAV